MSQILVNDLTFYYDGSADDVFRHASFAVDTDWKLGFIGRNGKGKTTFLKLLLGAYEYQGTITSPVIFDYFPYEAPPEAAGREEPGEAGAEASRTAGAETFGGTETSCEAGAGTSEDAEASCEAGRGLSGGGQSAGPCAAELMEDWKAGCESWRVIRELERLGMDAGVLYRPFHTLSHGERTRVMLAVLFSGENEFLLIDEPTNHLDSASRESVRAYLSRKKGFILVSHDRELLDACVDHVLVLNRHSLEVQKGNFSSWWENKSRKDLFSRAENEKHKKEIGRLRQMSQNTRRWADKSENSKIGFDPVKDPEHGLKRAYIGAKTKKMLSRVRQMEKRIDREIEEKEGLLLDLEEPVDLKLTPLRHHRDVLIEARDYSLRYADADHALFEHLGFELRGGDRLFLTGKNGCGKSSLIRALPGSAKPEGIFAECGTLTAAAGLVISYISQDTSFLRGTPDAFCRQRDLDKSLFFAVLNQLDVGREQFAKPMEDFSEGQKKKVLIAASLVTPAHLYIWDEPLNYVDVFSRMQIEKLILTFQPTMLVVEHDACFVERIATKTVDLGGGFD